MLEAFQMGGWGMYPTLIFGALAIAAAVRYVAAPDGARLLLVGILSAVNLIAGTLGFITGVTHSIQGSQGIAHPWTLIAQGTAESLYCVMLALCLLVLTGIVSAIGAFRASSRKGEPARAPAAITS